MARDEDIMPAPRESNNPVFEEYQEDLSKRPIFTGRDEDRIARLESLTSKLLHRVDYLEQKIQDMDMRRQQ
jgi:hypothetical protein